MILIRWQIISSQNRGEQDSFEFGKLYPSPTSATGLEVRAGKIICVPEFMDRKRFAFSASAWTSKKRQICRSHSSKVAVGPQRWIARAYSDQTGSITGWS